MFFIEFSGIVQLVERMALVHNVGGSNPSSRSILKVNNETLL